MNSFSAELFQKIRLRQAHYGRFRPFKLAYLFCLEKQFFFLVSFSSPKSKLNDIICELGRLITDINDVVK